MRVSVLKGRPPEEAPNWDCSLEPGAAGGGSGVTMASWLKFSEVTCIADIIFEAVDPLHYAHLGIGKHDVIEWTIASSSLPPGRIPWGGKNVCLCNLYVKMNMHIFHTQPSLLFSACAMKYE